MIISHGHYDHCGGLQYFSYENKNPLIYVHPNAFSKKMVLVDKKDSFREIGIPFELSEHDWIKKHIIYNRQPLSIQKDIMISGEIPCYNDFENVPRGFYIKKDDNSIMHDMILDEQMLIIEDDGEIAIFLGCSHPGIINSLNYAQKLFPNKNIKLLVAGMHLEHISSICLQMIIQHILDMNI